MKMACAFLSFSSFLTMWTINKKVNIDKRRWISYIQRKEEREKKGKKYRPSIGPLKRLTIFFYSSCRCRSEQYAYFSNVMQLNERERKMREKKYDEEKKFSVRLSVYAYDEHYAYKYGR